MEKKPIIEGWVLAQMKEARASYGWDGISRTFKVKPKNRPSLQLKFYTTCPRCQNMWFSRIIPDRCNRCRFIWDRTREREWKWKSYKRHPHLKIHAMLHKRLAIVLKRKKLIKTQSILDYGIDVRAIHKKLGKRPSPYHDIDHIIPCSAFDFKDPQQIKIAFSPDNLQWLEHSANLKKSDIWNDNGILKKGKKAIK